MRYLIDTNIFMFYISNQNEVNNNVLYILNDCGNTVYISSESVKKLIHLSQNGRIAPPQWKKSEDIIRHIKDDWDITIKYIREEHLQTFSRLDNRRRP
jgi:PIN domain nuclease of toxin-antitoxin system